MDRSRLPAARRAALLAAALSLSVALWNRADAGQYGLGTDEAHYALYGLHLDAGYFDHPPLVGWLQAAALRLGHDERSLRVVPILLGLAISFALYRLARALFPDDSPWLAALSVALVQGSIGFHVLAWWALPEGPLVLCGLLVSHALLLIAQQRDGPGTWLALGALLGLAGLSKYTAVTLAASALLVTVVARRRRLASPWPWLAGCLALLIVSPVLRWNAQHDWISFSYQWQHGTGGQGYDFVDVGRSQAGQLLAWGPLLFVGAWCALFAARRDWRQPAVLVTAAVALPVLVLFALSSGRTVTLPHWTALAFVAAAPLTARWLLSGWPRGGRRGLALASGLLAFTGIGGAHLLVRADTLPLPHGRDPAAAVRDWPAAARRALQLRAELAATPGPPPGLYVDRWTTASRLAWYARPAAVQSLDTRFDQFALWFGQPAPGERGVLVIWEDDPERVRGARALRNFESVREVEPLVQRRAGRDIGRFRFVLAEGYRGARSEASPAGEAQPPALQPAADGPADG